MASGKNGLSRAGCSKLFKTLDIAMKKSERHLLLSTTYGLNHSWSKKITVGLHLRLDGTFEPVIRLLNNYSSGVSLNPAVWEALVKKFDVLESYFEKDGERATPTNDTITLDNCSIRFTTAHGSKVVAFYSNRTDDGEEEVEEEEAEGSQTTADRSEDGAPAAKKKKAYSPVIVMQKVSFDGLKHISCCVNEHLWRLEELVTDVNLCRKTLVQYFASLAISRKMKKPTLQQISALVCEDSDAAREVVSLQCEGYFRDFYFDIVFCELLRMFLSFIIVDVRQTVVVGS